MDQKMDRTTLEKQAARVKEDCPELFDYLVQRDRATDEWVRGVFEAIPNPDDVPIIRIPFIDAIVELLAPRDRCPICDEDDDSLSLLPSRIRKKLCEICKKGVYLRGTGIGSLAR